MHLWVCNISNSCIDNKAAELEACEVQNHILSFQKRSKNIRKNMSAVLVFLAD